MSEKRAFADVVAAACSNATKQLQPPVTFYEQASQHRKAAEYLKSKITRAKRYILDDDVVDAAVDLGMQHPEILLAVLKNAMAPFDLMWIEWSPAAQLRASMKNHDIDESYVEGTPSGNVGVILERVNETGYRISMVGECLLATTGNEGATTGSMQYGASPLSIYYDVHAPVFGGQLGFAEQMVIRHTPLSEQHVRGALLAGAYHFPSAMKEEAIAALKEEEGDISETAIAMRLSEMAQMRMRQCDTLASHAQWTFDPVFGKAYRDRINHGPDRDPTTVTSRYYQHAAETLALQIQEEAGVFRFVISVIALMIGRDRLAADFIQPRDKNQSKFFKGRAVPFLENRRVSLTVPRKIANKRIMRSLYKSMPRAQHDVEGHWKQRRKGYDVNCDHVMVWETPKREVCAIEGCGFKRWRVDEFQRGDASIGVIKKTRVAELDRKVKPAAALEEQ